MRNLLPLLNCYGRKNLQKDQKDKPNEEYSLVDNFIIKQNKAKDI
jgi:hypothetical protein